MNISINFKGNEYKTKLNDEETEEKECFKNWRLLINEEPRIERQK